MNRDVKNIVLQVALDQFSKYGFDNTSTESIIKKANISKGLLFYHFKNKENILNDLLIQFNDCLAEILDTDNQNYSANEKLTVMIERYFHSLKKNFSFWKLYVKLTLDDSISAKICNVNSEFFIKYNQIMEFVFKENFGDDYHEKLFHFELIRKGIFFSYLSQPDENQLYIMKNFLLKHFTR